MTLLLALPALVACGPGYLTPDEVREHLDNPSGSVDPGSLGNVADDYFDAQMGMNAQDLAFFVKSDQGGGSRGNAQRMAGMVGASPLAKNTAGDIFCATTLVAQVASFDSCENEGDCEAELTIDACVLRLGEDGDENASGKLHFTLSEETSEEIDRGTMQVEFDKWETTVGSPEIIDHLDGILAFEYTDYKLENRAETIMSIDMLNKQTDPTASGLFRSGVVAEHRATAALRTTFAETETGETASLEVLAFTDEELTESLNLQFDYEATWVSDTHSVFDASMTVFGENGMFTCLWSSELIEQSVDSYSYSSGGTCTDESGESFDWSGDLVVEG